ncbi:MAG TPA: pyruvate dehydrogenase (acetyl-transferring) E1 component subunit alpha [Acidimicrobiaceae bacterium]|nr:pyruvate dehydrogenase (acetyl-transferring) E1 component subunit alpha [Acidimicrobiaceae bacterium]
MVTNQQQVKFYEDMVRVMLWEQRAMRLMQEGKVLAGYHSGRGQEAIPVGAITPLRDSDCIMYAHRGFGYTIQKGMSMVDMFADLMANVGGSTGGLGAGIPHFADPNLGILGQGGTLGTCFPIAAGAGFSAKYRGTDEVTICFFGDGTSNRGTFHEALNVASIWKLPVIWICENNRYAVSVPSEKSTAGRIVDRAIGYGIPGRSVDGMDVVSVYEEVTEAIDRARSGEGPTLIEAECYRFRGHHEGDPQVYREDGEIDEWRRRDPIESHRQRLIDNEVATAEQLDGLQAQMASEVELAAQEAENFPMPGPERVFQGV